MRKPETNSYHALGLACISVRKGGRSVQFIIKKEADINIKVPSLPLTVIESRSGKTHSTTARAMAQPFFKSAVCGGRKSEI